jgi:hypothetical protein
VISSTSTSRSMMPLSLPSSPVTAGSDTAGLSR